MAEPGVASDNPENTLSPSSVPKLIQAPSLSQSEISTYRASENHHAGDCCLLQSLLFAH